MERSKRKIEGRNPFVNQVFGFAMFDIRFRQPRNCRNPFVNQVFGFIALGIVIAGGVIVAIPS